MEINIVGRVLAEPIVSMLNKLGCSKLMIILLITPILFSG